LPLPTIYKPKQIRAKARDGVHGWNGIKSLPFLDTILLDYGHGAEKEMEEENGGILFGIPDFNSFPGRKERERTGLSLESRFC